MKIQVKDSHYVAINAQLLSVRVPHAEVDGFLIGECDGRLVLTHVARIHPRTSRSPARRDDAHGMARRGYEAL